MYHIVCAAFDSPEELKRKADYICPEEDARPTLQKAIDEADRLDVSCVLMRGTYIINSHGERTHRGGICFFNPEPPMKYYSQNRARYHVLEGAKTPLGYLDGAVITMGKEFYESLSDEEQFSLFYSDGNSLYGRGLIIRNLVVRLPGSHKPVIVFDGRFAMAARYEDNWVTSFDPREVNLATAEGIPVPHPKSIGFRGCAGSNFYSTEWKNLAVQGFGIGFDIGGEHVYCESLSALYNHYGFAFDCYIGRHSIDAAEDNRNADFGWPMYPVTCVNLLDEHNIHMPIFGNVGHRGHTIDQHAQAITIHGMNIQWPNTCPGHTDRLAPDYLEGRHRATEMQPGSWRGTIEYVIDHVTPTHGCNMTDEPFFEEGHGTQILVRNLNNKLK
ncbi:MAG: hypothetical protein E7632_09965 [Ruminococcaceae bacterium]|nr:hypothetical protein [Oscillospiraceae bacterium]